MSPDVVETDAGGTKLVPALARGHAILDVVSSEDAALTVSDLARRLELPKSTVHGLCATLVELGLLVRRSDNSFRIGPHVMHWSNAFMASTDIVSEFAAIWDSLNVLAGETVTLTVLDGAEVVYIAARNSNSPLGVTFRIGMRLPAAYTATGKAILATMSDAEVRAVMANRWPAPLTSNSVPNVEALIEELAGVRERGYSVDNGQVRDGMWCFGTAVRNSANKAIAGVAVSLLQLEVDPSTTRLVSTNVQTVAQLLSARMGADIAA